MNNRQRVIEIIKIFEEESDENNSFTISQIIDKLKQRAIENINPSTASVKDDIRDIDELYMPINMETKGNGHPIKYSYQERLFELHELKMLMDAVTAARFIPIKDTKSLLFKIKKLTSKNVA